jgi:hypothetical protein
MDGFPIVEIKAITPIVDKCEPFSKNETSMSKKL